jgi:tight adherence protein C
MLIINNILNNRDLVFACFSAMSVFLAVVVVSWSHLVPDVMGNRMRQIADEREAIRVRERRKLHRPALPALRTEPKKIFKKIFDSMNLAKEAEDGNVANKLEMAGYRGRSPVVTFLAVRLIMPVVLFVIAALYVFVVLRLQLSPFFKLGIAIAAALAGFYLPLIYLNNRIGRRQHSIRRAWPDALDLMLICVESGMAVENAFRKVSEEIVTQSIELAEELALTTAELSYLADRRMAYDNLARRTGLDGVKGVVTALVQSEKYGTPVGQTLRLFAQEQRHVRLNEAEKKAAQLPPKLTVPMILFFLPVLFAVILTPAIIQIQATH